MIHVMLDLETWSTRPDALIVSVGAVKFDAENIIDRFHVGIDPVNAQGAYNRHIDAKTMLYWLDPKRDEARAKLLALPKIDMFHALDGFVIFCNETPVDQRGSLWGKGATFDNVLSHHAVDQCGLEWPFSHRQDECYRTMANRFPAIEYEQIGTAHEAIADAESQAIHLQRICAHAGIAL